MKIKASQPKTKTVAQSIDRGRYTITQIYDIDIRELPGAQTFLEEWTPEEQYRAIELAARFVLRDFVPLVQVAVEPLLLTASMRKDMVSEVNRVTFNEVDRPKHASDDCDGRSAEFPDTIDSE